jgi:hypothetical protein
MSRFFYDLSSNELLELKNEITYYSRIRNVLILVGLFSAWIIASIVDEWYEGNNQEILNLIALSPLLVIPLCHKNIIN